MFTVLGVLVCCILKLKKNIKSSINQQNENILRRKNIFQRIWDLRLKKKIDDRVYGNILKRTDSEISHVSNTMSNLELNAMNIQTQSTPC